MAPPQLFATPIEQLAELLAESRAAGLPFDEAWRRAIRPGSRTVMASTPNAPADAVRWPTDSTRRILERDALRSTRSAWRRAYEGRPATPRERAVAVLAPLLAELGAGERVAA